MFFSTFFHEHLPATRWDTPDITHIIFHQKPNSIENLLQIGNISAEDYISYLTLNIPLVLCQMSTGYGSVYKVFAIFDHGSFGAPSAHVYRQKSNIASKPDTILGVPNDGSSFFVADHYLAVEEKILTPGLSFEVLGYLNNDLEAFLNKKPPEPLHFLFNNLSISTTESEATAPIPYPPTFRAPPGYYP